MIENDDKTSELDKALKKSIIVGAIHLVFGAIYFIDGSPNDMNIGFWLYGPLGLFVLWPYQIVLALKLRTSKAANAKYTGVILSILSLFLTTGIW